MITRYEQFASSIATLYHHIQKIQRSGMARYGLKGAHVHCLLAISRYPEGITASRLCQICDRDKAAISRTLAELEEAGLISRPAGSPRRYRVRICLTEKGQRLTAEVRGRVALAVQQADSGLTPESRESCYESMQRIAENLRRISSDGIFED